MKISSLALITAALIAVPAVAGTMTYNDGATKWESTGCTPPSKPMFANTTSGDKQANTLNANNEAYNEWTRSVQAYLQCVAKEANADMQGVNNGITAQLQQVNQAWQNELNQQATA